MTPELAAAVARLLAASAASGTVTLDELGDAIDTLPVTTDEIDAVLAALEAAGRRVAPSDERDRMGDLRAVLAAARGLRLEQGRPPSTDDIAARSGLRASDVRTALLLARVLGR
jgi:hypothetical protein